MVVSRIWPHSGRIVGGVAAAAFVYSSLYGVLKRPFDGTVAQCSALDVRKDNDLSLVMTKREECLVLAS
jgi:hypothetical protein